MEDRSQHPLESETSFPSKLVKSRPGFWLVITIVLFTVLFIQPKLLGNLSVFALLGGIFSAAMTVGHWVRALRENAISRKSLTDLELAQYRLKSRQQKRFLALVSLGIFCILILTNIAFGGYVAGKLIPLMLFALFLSLYYGLQAYYSSPQRIINQTLIEKEMIWLFGENWQTNTGAFEYTFAQDRIRLRRRNRWLFGLHLLVYLPVSAFSLYAVFSPSTGAMGQLCLVIPITWSFLLFLPHALQAFPTAGMLARRERKVAQNLQAEIDSMYPTKAKNEEKTKTETHYQVGDDGELVEVEDDALLDDDKPKREQRG